MENSKLAISFTNESIVFHVVEEGTMIVAPTIKGFISKYGCKTKNNFPKIIFDLSECNYIDSTFVGTMLLIDNKLKKYSENKMVISCPTRSCMDILSQMSLDRYFIIDDVKIIADNNQKITVENEEIGELDKAQFLLRAHKALSDINDSNKEKFELVIKLLQEEISKKNAE